MQGLPAGRKPRQTAARAAGLPILCSLAKSCPKYSGRQRPKVSRGSSDSAIYSISIHNKAHRNAPVGFLRYMRESIGKRLTVKHLTTVCLQSDKGQVKQLSLYSHTVFFAAFRRTLRATVHFGAHIRESGALIRSCALTHLSVLIWEHLLPKSSRSRSTVIVAPMSITFPSGVCTTG